MDLAEFSSFFKKKTPNLKDWDFFPCLSSFCHFLYPSFAPSAALLSSLASSFHLFSAVSSFLHLPPPPSPLLLLGFLLLFIPPPPSLLCLYLFSHPTLLSPFFVCLHRLHPTYFIYSSSHSLSFFLRRRELIYDYVRLYLQLCLKTLTKTFSTTVFIFYSCSICTHYSVLPEIFYFSV